MSNSDRSSSARTATLHCRPACVVGGSDPVTWSKFPATQTVNLGCNDLSGVSSVTFCDGTYMGPGGSFDISSTQNIDITANSGSGVVEIKTTSEGITGGKVNLSSSSATISAPTRIEINSPDTRLTSDNFIQLQVMTSGYMYFDTSGLQAYVNSGNINMVTNSDRGNISLATNGSIGTEKISLSTPNLELNGSALESNSSGGSANKYLAITLNGVAYKIKLELA